MNMNIKMSESSRYGFAVGRVRSLEVSLLDRNRYDRLVRARGRSEFMAVLQGSSYGQLLADETGVAAEPSRVFTLASAENFGFFSQYCVDTWLLDLFRLQADFHNLKVLLKRQLSGTEPGQDEMLDYGNWQKGQLGSLAARDPKAEPAPVAQACSRIAARYESDKDPAGVDIELDRLAQEMSLERCLNSDFMTGFYRQHADLENVRTLVRVKVGQDGGQPAATTAALSRALLPGGSLPGAWFGGLVAAEWDAVIAQFAKTPFRHLVEDGIGWVLRRKSMLRLERLGREMEIGFLRRSRYAVFGHEPLVTYFLLRMNEVRNLRQLYAAKLAGLPDDMTQELVAWVA